MENEAKPKTQALPKINLLPLAILLVAIVLAVPSCTEPTNGGNNKGSSGGTGDASCQYAVESNIEGAGGIINGIAYKGEGVFEALVANETTNYKYKYVLFYTDSECNVVNVRVK